MTATVLRPTARSICEVPFFPLYCLLKAIPHSSRSGSACIMQNMLWKAERHGIRGSSQSLRLISKCQGHNCITHLWL